MNRPQNIIVHHTLVSYDKNPAQFNATNTYHKSKGYTKSSLGFFVGYHYMIEKDGTVRKAREESDVGAHTKEQSMNYKSIGICLTGNFDVEDPTQAQVFSAIELIESIQKRYNIPDSNVFPHRHFAPKTCWGSRLDSDILSYLRGRLEANTMPSWAIPAFDAAEKYGYSRKDPLEIIATVRGRHALAKDPLLKGHLADKEEPVMYCEYVTALWKAGRFN